MFRTMPIKIRLMLAGIISAVAVIALSSLSVYSLWQSELELERQITETEAIRLELAMAKAHVSMEGDVFEAVIAGRENAVSRKQAIAKKIEADRLVMETSVKALAAIELSSEISQHIVTVQNHVVAYTQAAQIVLDHAFSNIAQVGKSLEAFQEHYVTLEAELANLEHVMELHAAHVVAEARAHDTRLLYGLLGVSLIALIVTVLNARKVSQNVTKPIGRMREALKDVAAGDFRLRIADRMRADDFGEIAQDIDAVSQRVISALDEQNRLREESDHVIEQLRSGLQRLADGNLTTHLTEEFSGNYDGLRANYNETVDRLNSLISQVVQGAERMETQSAEVHSVSGQLSQRAIAQATTLEETASSLKGMTASANSSAQKAQEVSRVTTQFKAGVEESGQTVDSAVLAMKEIETSSAQISQIVSVIDDISFQTNLLALNAGVEAARAGTVGRGFAVVASEVLALAQRSANAATEIQELITKSSAHVEDGVSRIESAGGALASVVAQVADVTNLVSQISAETTDQAQSLQQINARVSQLDQVTQQNTSMAESSREAAKLMSNDTKELNDLMAQFSLKEQCAAQVAMLKSA